jgi:hypothetical protein
MRARCMFIVLPTDKMDCGPLRKRQRRLTCGRTEKGNRAMFDLICLAIIVLFIAVAAVFARGCERLEMEE